MMSNILKGLVRLSAARPIARKPLKLQYIQRRSIYPHLSSNVISGPPRVRIGKAEPLLALIWFATVILGTPVYVLLNLNNYRTLPNIWDEVVEEEVEEQDAAAEVAEDGGADADETGTGEAAATSEGDEVVEEKNDNC